MPTGYTATLYDGKEQTLPEFVMSCARAFGALVMMRDDPADAPIPDEFQPSDYYARREIELRGELADAQSWTVEEAGRRAKLEHDRRLSENRKAIREGAERRARYEAMLEQVKAWEPPTAEHTGLKEFMVKQLEESIDFDCNTDYFAKPIDPPPLGERYKAQKISRLKEQIADAVKYQTEEVERTNDRNKWVRALRESLQVTS